MGRCFNKACTASKHPANISWIRKGYGTFYIGESACNNKCQSCKQPINPKYVQTIGFSRAKLTIEGCMKVNETETANIHKTAEQKKGDLVYWKEFDDEKTEWYYLKVIA